MHPDSNTPAPLCACGCGQSVTMSKSHRNRWNTYIHGHSRRLAGHPEVVCTYCGTSFVVHPYRSASAKYCSKACQNAAKHQPRALLADRFWSHVDKSGECWEWTGALHTTGYGVLFILKDGQRDVVRAHRLAYEMTYGPIPDGLEVCHHCDNRRCIRPDHLFVGTRSDNMKDMVQKGRGGVVAPTGDQHYARLHPELVSRGEARPNAKLTADTVRVARKSWTAGEFSKSQLALRLGVTLPTVCDFIARRTWKHVQ